MSRLCPYFFKHKCYFFLGILASILDGFIFPSLGIFLARILVAMLHFTHGEDKDENRHNIQVYYFIALGLAIAGSITNTSSLYFFFSLSKEIVQEIRL